jgi:hypothetical protein
LSDDFDTSASKNGYDPDVIYGATTNTKGFTARMRIAVPPEVLAIAGELAATRKLDGIKTPADMIRDALVHRLHHYSAMLETTDPWLSERMSQASHRIAYDSKAEERIRTRDEDHKRMERAIHLWRLEGDAALPMVKEALDVISTDECKATLAAMIGNWESRGNGR